VNFPEHGAMTPCLLVRAAAGSGKRLEQDRQAAQGETDVTVRLRPRLGACLAQVARMQVPAGRGRSENIYLHFVL